MFFAQESLKVLKSSQEPLALKALCTHYLGKSYFLAKNLALIDSQYISLAFDLLEDFVKFRNDLFAEVKNAPQTNTKLEIIETMFPYLKNADPITSAFINEIQTDFASTKIYETEKTHLSNKNRFFISDIEKFAEGNRDVIKFLKRIRNIKSTYRQLGVYPKVEIFLHFYLMRNYLQEAFLTIDTLFRSAENETTSKNYFEYLTKLPALIESVDSNLQSLQSQILNRLNEYREIISGDLILILSLVFNWNDISSDKVEDLNDSFDILEESLFKLMRKLKKKEEIEEDEIEEEIEEEETEYVP